MSNDKIIKKEVITTHEDADGKVSTSTVSTTTNIKKSEEPDYIKLYTKMWFEFNGIPKNWVMLFIQLATRMSYSDATDIPHSQTVVVYGGVTEDICKICGWKDKSVLRRGLKVLCDCGAIKKTKFRATYQINPTYAGKGNWNYNPKLKNGGIKDLVATFSFKDKTVDTKYIWADDAEDSEINETMREGLGVTRKQEAILSHTTTQNLIDSYSDIKDDDDDDIVEIIPLCEGEDDDNEMLF